MENLKVLAVKKLYGEDPKSPETTQLIRGTWGLEHGGVMVLRNTVDREPELLLSVDEFATLIKDGIVPVNATCYAKIRREALLESSK